MLIPAAMASLLSSMAPSRDSSASRLWGGTRPPPRWRRRASSMDWTMVAHSGAKRLGNDRAQTCRSRGGEPRGCPQGRTHVRTLPALCDNLHGQADLDLGMQPQGDLVHTQGPDGLVEVKAAALDLHARLPLDGGGDISRGHRPEQATLGAGPGLDADGDRSQAGRHFLGRLAVSRVSHGPGAP